MRQLVRAKPDDRAATFNTGSAPRSADVLLPDPQPTKLTLCSSLEVTRIMCLRWSLLRRTKSILNRSFFLTDEELTGELFCANFYTTRRWWWPSIMLTCTVAY